LKECVCLILTKEQFSVFGTLLGNNNLIANRPTSQIGQKGFIDSAGLRPTV